MLILTVHLTILPDQVDAFLPKVLENARLSKADAGCHRFDVLVDPKDRTRVLLYEIYEDAAAFAAHEQSAHFKKYVVEAVPLLATRERHFWNLA